MELLDAGLSQRQLSTQWINVRTGKPYSQAHVSLVARAYRDKSTHQPRPRFREAYNIIANPSSREDVASVNGAVMAVMARPAAESLAHMARSLRTVRDERLYRETHETFDAYCRARWNFTAAFADEVITLSSGDDALQWLMAMAGDFTHEQVD